MIEAMIYGKMIKAETMTQIKRLASIEANKRYHTVDDLYIIFRQGLPYIHYTRVNKKSPNNTIIRGEWG